MSLFDTLKNAIFRHGPSASAPAGRGAKPAVPANPSGQVAKPAGIPPAGTQPSANRPASTAPASAPAASTAGTSAAAPAPVDIEAVLDGLNAKGQADLAWRTSIVDLMKLVGMDSSFQHRKELAAELGYKGDPTDSASMNIWLHKEVMKQLAANGGKVPSSLQ